jgi:CRP-like cAMP-binding protein
MAPHEIAALVNKLNPRLLEGLAPDDLTCVLDVGTIRRFRRHALLAREGYSADNLFLLLEGLGRTFTTTPKGEKMVLLWISPGELSGGRAILSQPSKYLVSTETVTNSTALVWERKTMLSLSKRFSRLLENALLISSDYLAAYRDFHVAANYETAPQGSLTYLAIWLIPWAEKILRELRSKSVMKSWRIKRMSVSSRSVD